MDPTEKSFTKIGSITVYYDRGAKPKQRATWRTTHEFYDTLVKWKNSLSLAAKRHAGYDDIDFITSAGFFVDKSGQHGKGTAFDLDRIHWKSGQSSKPLEGDHKHGFTTRRRRYLGVDASLRRYFRFVLNGFYNAAHEDHLHADFGGLPTILRKSSESDTKFVQAVLNEFNDAKLVVDGDFGRLTSAAFSAGSRKIGMSRRDPFGSSSDYRAWLWRVVIKGLQSKPF